MGLFKTVSSGFRKFTHNAGNALKNTAGFVEKKALPAIEKIAKGASKALTYATPLLAGVAPELLPLALGAKALANKVSGASMSGEKLLSSTKKIASGLESGNVKQIISSVKEASPEIKRLTRV
jgi:hypothetical protein